MLRLHGWCDDQTQEAVEACVNPVHNQAEAEVSARQCTKRAKTGGTRPT
jgi:hypothetical protein